MTKTTHLLTLLVLSLALFLGAGQEAMGFPGSPPGAHPQADSLNMRLVGSWYVCNAMSVANDEERDLTFVGGGGKITILDVSDPASPQETGSLESAGIVWDLAFYNGYLYAADWENGLKVISVSDPQNPAPVATLGLQGLLWGLTVADSIAYLVCGDDGLMIYSVSDPANPVLLGTMNQIGYATSIAVSDTFAVVTDQSFGLRVLSVANPGTPVEIGAINLPGTAWDVALLGHHAYVAAGGAGLRIVSLAEPSSPVEIGSLDPTGYARSVAVLGDQVYMGNGGSGMRLISAVDKAHPEEIGYYNTNGYSWAVSLGDSMAFVADGEGGSLILQYTGFVGIEDGGEGGLDLPQAFSLSQNYPNPFNPTTTIQFTVPQGHTGRTLLEIFDARGRAVKTLVESSLPPGRHTVVWDGRNAAGEKVASGIYLFSLKTGEKTVVRKMSVIR
jgi:hypothetical protein